MLVGTEKTKVFTLKSTRGQTRFDLSDAMILMQFCRHIEYPCDFSRKQHVHAGMKMAPVSVETGNVYGGNICRVSVMYGMLVENLPYGRELKLRRCTMWCWCRLLPQSPIPCILQLPWMFRRALSHRILSSSNQYRSWFSKSANPKRNQNSR